MQILKLDIVTWQHCALYIYMLGANYGFAQSMDPYFTRAIHGLRVHLSNYFFFFSVIFLFNVFNPCTCMACINQLAS